MQNKAYSLLEIKSIDEEKREITGIASTITADRMGDVVDPKGAEFSLPISLLWQHDHEAPVGEVFWARVIDDNRIEFKARIARAEKPQSLVERLELAWESVKSKLVRGVSIGFIAKEWGFIEATGGQRIDVWDWLELSLVTIPANAEATIQTIKSYSDESRAASGKKMAEAEKAKPASVVATKTVKLDQKEKKAMTKKTGDQIKAFGESRTSKMEEMGTIMQKAAEDGNRTLNAEEKEKYDELNSEVKEIDEHLERLKAMQSREVATAKPVTEAAGASSEKAAETRAGALIQVKAEVLQPGVRFARLVKCLGQAKGSVYDAERIAQSRYGNDGPLNNFLKSAVAAGTTLHSTWAKPLVGQESEIFADFAEFLRPQTIVGQFGAGRIPGLTRVPFRTRLISQTSGGSASWVGEGKGKPVTKFDFAGTTLAPLKVADICVVTKELLRDSSPSADLILRDQLAATIRERIDVDFIDPSKTAVANVSPASITNGVSASASSGDDADAVRADIATLWSPFIAANNPPTRAVYIMSSMTALRLGLMRNAFGQKEFPDLTINGGFLDGVPVIVSEYVPTVTAGSYVFLVNASDIWFADEDGVEIDMSDEASLQMDTAPTQDATGTPTATSVVSMFQTNCVAFRAERTLNWSKRRASAVSAISAVNWGAAA